MVFDLDRYEYVDHMRKDPSDPAGPGVREIIAIAHYNGKAYKGHARCHPDDTFDLQIGKELAARRCDLAIRYARLLDRYETLKEAKKKKEEADNILELASKRLNTADDDYYLALEIYNGLYAGLK